MVVGQRANNLAFDAAQVTTIRSYIHNPTFWARVSFSFDIGRDTASSILPSHPCIDYESQGILQVTFREDDPAIGLGVVHRRSHSPRFFPAMDLVNQ